MPVSMHGETPAPGLEDLESALDTEESLSNVALEHGGKTWLPSLCKWLFNFMPPLLFSVTLPVPIGGVCAAHTSMLYC